MAESPPPDSTDRDQPSRLRENQDPEDNGSTGRRGFLGALVAAGISLAGLAGYSAGTAQAQTAAGEVGTSSNPYSRAYVTTVNFEDLGSDPSSPDDGAMWYNSNA